MIEYDTLDELWIGAAHHVLTQGQELPSRDGGSLEVLGWAARLADPAAHFMFNPERRMSPAYAGAELLWYLSGSADITIPVHYAPQYVRFAEDGHTAWGAYGRRLAGLSAFQRESRAAALSSNGGQLAQIAKLLQEKPETRQAVASLWNEGDLPHAVAGDRRDLPCTLSLQFLLRGGRLCLIATMRSNDVWLGLPYDVFCFTSLQLLMAEQIGVEPGWYQHQVGSLHVYDRDRERTTRAVEPPAFNTGPLEYAPHGRPVRDAVCDALIMEQHVRWRGSAPKVPVDLHPDSLLAQAARMCAARRRKPAVAFSNKLLTQYVETVLCS